MLVVPQLDLDSIVERLKAECPVLREVAGSVALELAYKSNVWPAPCAYVLVDNEGRAGENESGTGYAQEVPCMFAVAIVARNVGDPNGAGAHGDLQPVRVQVMSALCNWKPEWAANPIEFDSGKVADRAPGLLFWEDKFRTSFYLEA